MPANKNHHFVPKLYLRNFSRHEKSIDLFNIASERFIPRAPLKGQCCRDYFYGKDPGPEKSLSQIEGLVADLFRRMLSEERLPRPFTAGHLILCLHVVMQHYRTQHAADALDEMTDGLFKATFKNHPKFSATDLDRVRYGYKEPALFATGVALEGFPIVMDLAVGALLSPQGQEFITSDNPVVMYNQFMNWRKLGSNTGLASKGLVIFFPIYPWLTLVLYDRDVYHFGPTKRTAQLVASTQDVFELNVLQVASASQNLYIFGPYSNVYAAVAKGKQFRRQRKAVIETFEQPSDSRGRSAIIAVSAEDVRTDAQLSFLRVHKHAKKWLAEFQAARSHPAVVLRNDGLHTRWDRHVKQVRAGLARREDTFKALFDFDIVDDTY